MFSRSLLTESVQIVLGKAPLNERACVVTGGGVTLEENVVAAAGVLLAAEEVVQSDLVQSGN